MGTVHMSRAEAGQVLITANHIHHNVRDSSGYGVVVGHGAYATVEGNVFDFNRHAVACDGRPFTGYIAHLNYVLEGGYCEGGGTWGYYNQHFDVHGRGAGGYGGYAGEYFDISYNTVRGEQMYDGVMTRPALMLRGSPSVGAYFNSNVLCHDDSGEAVRLDDGSLFASAFSNVFIGTNRYNLDPSNELLTGDFDGDGKDDVLLGNGTARFVSRAGQTSWRLIGGSPYRRSEIAVGRFDSNGKDDVFVRASDGGWYFSSAASGPLTRLGSSGVAMSELRFGDFDGDGLTDIFRADGTKWWVSWSGRSTWSALNTSVGRVADLRFGDFDGDGTTDVFSLSGGQWSYARGGKGSWQRLNSLLSSDLSSLVFADFDGDGKSDIAQRDSSNGWRYSQRGQTAWRVLRTASGQTQFADPRLVVFGDFDGDGTADALRFDTASRRFVRWSSRVGDAFAAWSRHDMR
ncbi:MAG: VCBS repeat-containing protein [Myxococcales bacterium]|nr:VCBS repeat-containing protein [Myxococcales bacterium]